MASNMFVVRGAMLVLDRMAVSDEEATHATVLQKNDQGLVDISEITACANLQTLSLQFNKLSGDDLRPISRLWRLDSLDLRHNLIDHLDLLVPVDTEIRHSRPSSNTVSPMGTPRRLDYSNYDSGLSAPHKTNIIQVSMWQLRVLRLSHNYIEDLAPLALCQYVEELWIDNNRVDDIRQLKHLAGMNNLDKLVFHPNPLSQGRFRKAARFYLMATVSIVNWLDGAAIDDFERAACKDWIHGRQADDASQKMPRMSYADFLEETNNSNRNNTSRKTATNNRGGSSKKKTSSSLSKSNSSKKSKGKASSPGRNVFEESLRDPLSSTVKRVKGSVFGKMSDSAHVDFKHSNKPTASSSSSSSLSKSSSSSASDVDVDAILAKATRETHAYLFGGGQRVNGGAEQSPLDSISSLLPDLSDLRKSLMNGNKAANLSATYTFGGRFVPPRERGIESSAVEHTEDWNSTMLLEPAYVKRVLPRMKSLPTIKHKVSGTLRVRKYPKPNYKHVRSKISATRSSVPRTALVSTRNHSQSSTARSATVGMSSRPRLSSTSSASGLSSMTSPLPQRQATKKILAKQSKPAARTSTQPTPQHRFVVIRNDGSVYCTWPNHSFAAMVDQDVQDGYWRIHANYDSKDAMLCVVDEAGGIVNYSSGNTALEYKARSYGSLFAENGAKLLAWDNAGVTVHEEVAVVLLKQAVVTLRLDHRVAFRCNIEDGRFALFLSLEEEHVMITCSGGNQRSHLFASQDEMMKAPRGLLGSSKRIKGNPRQVLANVSENSSSPSGFDLNFASVRDEDGKRLVAADSFEDDELEHQEEEQKTKKHWKYTGPKRQPLRQPSQAELEAMEREKARAQARKAAIARDRAKAHKAIEKNGLDLSRSGVSIVTGLPVDRTVLMARHDWTATQYWNEFNRRKHPSKPSLFVQQATAQE